MIYQVVLSTVTEHKRQEINSWIFSIKDFVKTACEDLKKERKKGKENSSRLAISHC